MLRRISTNSDRGVGRSISSAILPACASLVVPLLVATALELPAAAIDRVAAPILGRTDRVANLQRPIAAQGSVGAPRRSYVTVGGRQAASGRLSVSPAVSSTSAVPAVFATAVEGPSAGNTDDWSASAYDPPDSNEPLDPVGGPGPSDPPAPGRRPGPDGPEGDGGGRAAVGPAAPSQPGDAPDDGDWSAAPPADPNGAATDDPAGAGVDQDSDEEITDASPSSPQESPPDGGTDAGTSGAGDTGNAGDSGSAPGNSGNAPGHSDDGSPGDSENAPGHDDDSSPGNSENAPGHDGYTGNSVQAHGHLTDWQ